MCAGLSLGEGDHARARDLLTQVSIGRNPMGNIYGDYLARQLDVLDEHLTRKRANSARTPDQRHSEIATTMAALKAEMTRRSWN